MSQGAALCNVHKLVADVALLADGHVLLARYPRSAAYDYQTGWFLPDDFLAAFEHPDAAAGRILTAQVGLAVDGLTLDHVESFGEEGEPWHLVFHYRGELENRPSLTPSAAVADAQWYRLDQLPDPADVGHGGWALDTLTKILQKGL